MGFTGIFNKVRGVPQNLFFQKFGGSEWYQLLWLIKVRLVRLKSQR